MVHGIESFRKWFADYSDQYVIIGGTACDLLMTQDDFDFRATRDIDMVLILESLTSEFGAHFWQYVCEAGYEHCNKSTGEPQFYRFSHPASGNYPFMIELFSRRSERIQLPESAHLTPLPLDDEISSLSAILMDEEYYRFLLKGRIVLDGIPILDAGYLIPFKIRAYLDLSERKANGEAVDSKDIRKHKNDVIRLSVLLTGDARILVSHEIYADIEKFLEEAENSKIDVKQFGIRNQSQSEVIERIRNAYIKESQPE